MKKVFVDSNVFLRFMLADDAEQRAKAKRLFERAAAREVALATGAPVFLEISWVLRRIYKKPREEVLGLLADLLDFVGLELADRPVLEGGLTLAFEWGLEFADAYIISLARSMGAEEVATFDRHFQRATDLYPL